MQIDFYEEFPKKENLEKLKLVKWKTRVFVAAKSLEEFRKLERQAKKIKKNAEVAYWPIIPGSYWISPFSNAQDLKETFRELDSVKDRLLIDLELPLKNKILFIKNIFAFRKNKRLIRRFLEKNRERVTTAEYPFSLAKFVADILGLRYKGGHEKSIMWYTSMLPRWVVEKSKKEFGKIKDLKEYSVSLGTIDIGIMGDEPILSPESLEKDLEFCKSCGFKKVIIFRLSGINGKYIKVLEKFAIEEKLAVKTSKRRLKAREP